MKEYQDYYFRKAKGENYPARSIYKLKEIDAKFKLLKKGQKIVDLGAAPGSWSIGAAEKTGSAGLVLSCDLKPVEVEFPPQVIFRQEDIFNQSDDFKQLLGDLGPFDLVLSDMAPATTGTKFADQARSYELVEAAFYFSQANLRQGGNFVAKIFMGPDMRILQSQMARIFGGLKTFKPKSSRSESKEIYIIATGLKK